MEQKQDQKQLEQDKKEITVGIAIDPWKYSIFKKHLEKHNYQFTEKQIPDKMIMLYVKTSTPNKLAEVCQDAIAECQQISSSGSGSGGKNVH